MHPVVIEHGLLRDLEPMHCALIYPAGLPARWVEQVQRQVCPLISLQVPDRDDCKTLAVYGDVLSQIARAGLKRSGIIIGLGGGATTDLAGFVAATYGRGVAYYAIPTTLLGMVDAAIGGKTGLNLPEGKNLVGAFYLPTMVWCDTEVLSTLSPAMKREGAAEIYKHGLIARPDLLERVLGNDAWHEAHLPSLVRDAMNVKYQYVEQDPKEQNVRAFLNFGHTLAHALESITHGTLSHGNAVAYGMHFAARLGQRLGYADLGEYTQAFLEWQQPDSLRHWSYEALRPYLLRDKKASITGIRFVLLKELAQPFLCSVTEKDLSEEWSLFVEELAMLGYLCHD